MHCKGYLITKKIPTNTDINKILDKYYEEKNNNLKFDYDWYCIGGRYCGDIKINFDCKQNEDNYFLFKNRNHKYFICDVLDEIKENKNFYEELDYLKYMGLRDNILYVDGGYYNDTIDFDITNCYLVIDDKETLYIREFWDNKKKKFIDVEDFENKIKDINLKDKFITVIDFHY